MTETDLQLGGGYMYQWECAILIALNYFFEPVRYNPILFDMVDNFLGQVDKIHLEGKDQESGIDLEDVTLVNQNRRILIQVKTKQAEGKRWTPTDPLLLEALCRFYDSRFLVEHPENSLFAFLTNRPFNPDLVKVKMAIKSGTLDRCPEVDKLRQHLARYLNKEKKAIIDSGRFRTMLARTSLIEYLGVDEVKANVQAKLQALSHQVWQPTYDSLFAHFAYQSTRRGGGTVTRNSVNEVLGMPLEKASSISILSKAQSRPALPTRGDPLALTTAALHAQRLLLVWANIFLLPQEHPPRTPAVIINAWQKKTRSLPLFRWRIPQLPPLSILSLDPTDRIERAFHQASVSLNTLYARSSVIARDRHNLLKLGGDLKTRSGLLLSWADVRVAPSDPIKIHLLEEAQRVAQDGIVLVFADSPSPKFPWLWNEMIHTCTKNAKHHFALGPVDSPGQSPCNTSLPIQQDSLTAWYTYDLCWLPIQPTGCNHEFEWTCFVSPSVNQWARGNDVVHSVFVLRSTGKAFR